MIDNRNTDALTLWKRTAYLTIVALAFSNETLSADETWAAMEELPQHPEPRALGGVFMAAKAAGVIEETGMYRKSNRAACHKRPIPVYRSLVYGVLAAGGTVSDNVIPFRRNSPGSLLCAG